MKYFGRNQRKTCSIKKQIEQMQRQKIASHKVVCIDDYRDLGNDKLKPVVLVVDDDEIIRSGLKRILESEGFEVLLAEDAMALSKVIDSRSIDFLLLDVSMPWVDGLELCQMIKSHPSLQKIPIVILSALSSKEDIARGFKSGCDDYIVKPFDVEHLLQTINRVLNLKAS